jgi:hypothetical protein
MSPANLIDETGRVHGRLTVTARAGATTDLKAVWHCRCVCGTEIRVDGKSLRSGNTKSCGCLQREKAAARASTGISITHGVSRKKDHPHYKTYNVWRSLIARCLNPTHKAYAGYGGRGISVAKRWQGKKGFENFLMDMGPQPPGLTLDRRNVNGPYCKRNCRWATWHDQHRNKRSNRKIRFRGKTLVLSDWAVELRVPVATLSSRIKRWGVEKALTSKPTVPNSVYL